MSNLSWKWLPRSDDEIMLGDINTIFEKWTPTLGDMATSLPNTSEIFVRELVQNFMDAADDQADKFGVPRLTFRFLTLGGNEMKCISDSLGLSELPQRWSKFKAEKRNPVSKMRESEFLEGRSKELKVLVVHEENTSGMYGPWHRTDEFSDSQGREILNKMRDALLAPARDVANRVGRGSYGEGKKALIGISKARSIITYSTFDPATTEDGTYSRLIGVTYWPNHVIENRKYTGMGILGDEKEGGVPEPFRNEVANRVFEQLGIPGVGSRGEGVDANRGTTYVFIDPMISPTECVEAIARNWWPAIDRGLAQFIVFDNEDELSVEAALEEMPQLAPFRALIDEVADRDVERDSWDLAEGPATRVFSPKLNTCDNESAGSLKLSIDLRPAKGFSQRDPDSNRTLVCLIRDQMVITYTSHYRGEAKDHPPFVRGVFEVNQNTHPLSQKLLRNSEPAVHNSWQIDADKVGTDAARHARAVRDEIRKSVNDLKSIYEKVMPMAEIDLPIFREVLSIRSMSGRLPDPVPPKPKSPYSMLDVNAQITDLGNGTRVATAKRSLQTSKLATQNEYQVQLELCWEILGDKGQWFTWLDAQETEIGELPSGFTRDNSTGLISGTVSSTPVVFELKSRPYSALYTVRPVMTVYPFDESSFAESDGKEIE